VRSRAGHQFTREDERRIETAASLASIAIEKIRSSSARGDVSGQADKMAVFKSGLMHNITHELRTSLSSLKAATDILINEKRIEPGGDYYERLLQSISRNVARQSTLVANLVDIGSLQDDTLKLRPERVDVPSLVAETTSIVAPLMRQHNQTLVVSAPPNLPEIFADRDRISQVLVNLMTNARKYAPEGSEVSLSVETKAGDVLFTVSDAGQGVPPDERERIFEPFYRMKKDSESGLSGSGLGLAIAKSLVELHRGRIWVEDSPAGGASFTFSLPIESGHENSGH
ncbi:MAG: sensor histidine kinase, partial [Ardenticatenaceae bacterium]